MPQDWQDWRGWSPFDVPETVAWFGARERVTNVSGAASAWATTAPPAAFTGTQSNASLRPAIANGINGRPTIAFTIGSNQLLADTTDILAAGAPRYALAVAKASTSVGGTIFQFRTTGAVSILYPTNIGGACYYWNDGVGGLASELTATAPDITQPFLIEWELTVGAPVVVRVNGVTRVLTSSNVSSDIGTSGFKIGESYAGQPWGGDVADIYIASGIPSASDRAKLRTFFSTANGLTPL